MSEKQKYLESIDEKAKRGLVDVKFYPANTFNVSEENAYAELNRMHAADDVPDREVLGNHSPDCR